MNILYSDLVNNTINRYNEPHRFYHNIDHVVSICPLSNTDDPLRLLFAIYHDIFYDPRRTDNEDISIDIMKDELTGSQYETYINDLTNLITLTKYNWSYYLDLDPIYWNIIKLDLDCFLNINIDIYETELAIFKEYQFVDWLVYKQKRIDILNSFQAKLGGLPNNITQRINFLNSWEPKIGIFAGSFNPFHKGHLNILEKAEKIFDKIIVAVGVNASKESQNLNSYIRRRNSVDVYLKYRQVDLYTNSIVDYLIDKKYPNSLIRGLRTGNDFGYEYNFANTIRDICESKDKLSPNIYYIMCDREYSHVSSTAVRELSDLGFKNLYL